MRDRGLLTVGLLVDDVERAIALGSGNEEAITRGVASALAPYLGDAAWLPPSHAVAAADTYRQYPLHVDPAGRFSIVSFVWGPGHSTPVHDHTVWGVIGVLRGAERCEEYAGRPLERRGEHVLRQGDVDIVSPAVGDIHRVSNADPAGVSISIHVYGADIGRVRRHAYDPARGTTTEFVSGYSSPMPV
jgi:predicted metal-dependent enzyme (double-stranded beta helix superfamily)